MYPVKINTAVKTNLRIKWNDGSESILSTYLLRNNCPCATCLAERDKHGKNYIPIFNANQTKISNISLVGNYAIGISWSDGHNTGIYEFTYLQKLSVTADKKIVKT